MLNQLVSSAARDITHNSAAGPQTDVFIWQPPLVNPSVLTKTGLPPNYRLLEGVCDINGLPLGYVHVVWGEESLTGGLTR